jgi:type II secretory ATPase GspE/PulE/Tfp pilus assembly ATPase PilB-like protein
MNPLTPLPEAPANAEPMPAIVAELTALDPREESYAARFVDALLAAGRRRGASDIHLLPAPRGLEIRWRVDGVLQPLGCFSPGGVTNVVMRLKVLADLLTYRADLPQEGRIRASSSGAEMRVSTFPTVHGERAVVRIFTSGDEHRRFS